MLKRGDNGLVLGEVKNDDDERCKTMSKSVKLKQATGFFSLLNSEGVEF